MEFDSFVLCLIGTALTTAAATLIKDAATHFKYRRARAGRGLQGVAPRVVPEGFPCPIAHRYPVERTPLPPNVTPINRTARARAQFRISGAALSEMGTLLGEVNKPPAYQPPRSMDLRQCRRPSLVTPGTAAAASRA